MNNKFTYVSLFSGIGGFEQALNKLEGQCVMASEYDPKVKTQYNQMAYEVLYGYKPMGDVTKIDAKDVPEHDLLVGGFPCQAFSVAGNRKGFEDTRGTLFFEIARIAKEKQPKVLLLENVKGLVNHDKGKTLNIMIEILNEIGYIIDFNILNSKYFGVPQNRERIFIVAIREDLIKSESFNEESIIGSTILPKRRREINEWAKTFNFDWPEQTEVSTRLRDVLEIEVDEKYYLDETKTAKLVKQLEEKTSANASEYAVKGDLFSRNSPQRQNGFDDTMFTVRSAIPHGVAISEPHMVGHVDIKGHDAIKRVYDPEAISPTLTTMGGGHREPKIVEQIPVQYNRKDGIGKELSHANTLSASDWRGLNRNQNQDAVLEEVRATLTPERISKRQEGRRFKENDEPSFTVNTQDRHGVTIGVKPQYRIRKLTPLECFRLQGFQDEDFNKLVDAGISNSQLYKMAGNAVTVNVVEAIGKNLITYITE